MQLTMHHLLSSLKKFREMFSAEPASSPMATRPSTSAVEAAKPAAAGRRARYSSVEIPPPTHTHTHIHMHTHSKCLTQVPVLLLVRLKFPPKKTTLLPNPLLLLPPTLLPPILLPKASPFPPLSHPLPPLAEQMPPPKPELLRPRVDLRLPSPPPLPPTTGPQVSATQSTQNSVNCNLLLLFNLLFPHVGPSFHWHAACATSPTPHSSIPIPRSFIA
jgi:hypothetical protein